MEEEMKQEYQKHIYMEKVQMLKIYLVDQIHQEQ